jgi:hypothetical protein
MGKNHVRVYSEHKNVSNLYIHDRDAKAMEQMATRFDAIPCATAEELLSHVEAVNICVPTEAHCKLGQVAISRGIHTLIEKPICSTVQEGETLINSIPDGVIVGGCSPGNCHYISGNFKARRRLAILKTILKTLALEISNQALFNE